MNTLIQHYNKIYLFTRQPVTKIEIFYEGGFVADINGNCIVDIDRGFLGIIFLSNHAELLINYAGKMTYLSNKVSLG